jgi:hypothetical protein
LWIHDCQWVKYGDHLAELAAKEREIERLKAQATIAKLQWTEIAPDNLPKMGDEVGCFADDGCCVYDVCDIHLRFTYEVWVKKRAMTHFRPISPPAQVIIETLNVQKGSKL